MANKSVFDILSVVKGKGLFKSLSDNQIQRMCKDFIIKEHKKNEVVFYQSDNSTDLYMVLQGSVKAVLIDKDSNELLLAIIGEGDFFGEMSLLDGKPRSATVIALEDSVFGILKRDQFLTAIQQEPLIAVELLSALVQRMRITDDMLGAIAFLDVSQRIMKILMRIAAEKGELDQATGKYKIKRISQRDLAAMTGASREAISKALKILLFKCVIHEDEKHFYVSPVMNYF